MYGWKSRGDRTASGRHAAPAPRPRPLECRASAAAAAPRAPHPRAGRRICSAQTSTAARTLGRGPHRAGWRAVGPGRRRSPGNEEGRKPSPGKAGAAAPGVTSAARARGMPWAAASPAGGPALRAPPSSARWYGGVRACRAGTARGGAARRLGCGLRGTGVLGAQRHATVLCHAAGPPPHGWARRPCQHGWVPRGAAPQRPAAAPGGAPRIGVKNK